MRTPRAPKGRLRLSPIRPLGSVELDAHRPPTQRKGDEPNPLVADEVPFVRWDKFLPDFAPRFEQGHHITCVGRTGSGKTILLRKVTLIRDYVVVFATKQRDDSLYKPLQAEGFKIVESFHSDPEEAPRLILRPPLPEATRKAVMAQGDVFEDALLEIWKTGEWCVMADEVRYLTQTLKLGGTLETLWLQGRSMGISIAVATQRPVSVPLEAFSQANHFFFFAEHEKDNVDRMSEFTGRHSRLVREIIPRLPKHEVLYVNVDSGYLARTKVML